MSNPILINKSKRFCYERMLYKTTNLDRTLRNQLLIERTLLCLHALKIQTPMAYLEIV